MKSRDYMQFVFVMLSSHSVTPKQRETLPELVLHIKNQKVSVFYFILVLIWLSKVYTKQED